MRTTLLAATLTLALHANAQTTTPTPTTTHTATRTTTAANHPPAAPQFSLVLVNQPAPTIAPAPFDQNPIQKLRGTACAILVFAPDIASPELIAQFSLLERDELALTEHDAILVPNIAQPHASNDTFPGENISPGTDADQLSARLKFNVKPTDFAIIILDKDGTVKFRSDSPISVTSIGDRLNAARNHGE